MLLAGLIAAVMPAGLLGPTAAGLPARAGPPRRNEAAVTPTAARPGQTTATPTPPATATAPLIVGRAFLPLVRLNEPRPEDLTYAPYFAYNSNDWPGGGWWSGLTIVNLDGRWVSVLAWADPNFAATARIPPFAAITLLPADFTGMPRGYSGSVRIWSDGAVAAAVTVTNHAVGVYGVPGGLAKGEYEAVTIAKVATTAYYPAVARCYPGDCSSQNAASSVLFALNAGQSATSVSAQYTCIDQQTYAAPPIHVEPNARARLTAGAAGVPPGQLCRARIAADQPLAVVVVEAPSDETVATRIETTRAPGDYDLGPVLYAPVFKKRAWTNPPNAQRTTAATVQNASTSPLTISAVYRGVGGSCPPPWSWSETSPPVPPGATYTFSNPLGMPDDCLAAATFSADGHLLGVAREAYLDPEPPPGTQAATVHYLLPGASASLQLSATFYEKTGGRTSALQVQNTASVTATLQLEFRRGVDRWRTVAMAIGPGAGRVFYLVSEQSIWSGEPLPPDSDVQVFAFADQPIAAVVTELNYPDCYGQGGGTCFDRKDTVAFGLHVRPRIRLDPLER